MNETTFRLAAVLMLCFALVSCRSSGALNKTVPIWAKGVDNFYRVTPNLYSGSQPKGDEGFEALRKLGVRTIISVDGVRPNITAALHNGMRYVHVPIGYGGINRDEQIRLVKAATTMPGPIFIHCHQGKHRGPAAMALVLIAVEDWSREHAAAWMRRAGTSAEYTGLYRTVNQFDPPSRRELKDADDQLPELVEPDTLVDAMVQIDESWQRFKKGRSAEDALLLRELFRELGRTDQIKRMPVGFMKLLTKAQQTCEDFETVVRTRPTRIDAAYKAVGKSCATCHRAYRN